ncbi:MAG: hypothetical protein PHN64_05665 [Desulfovibrionaceae bacterium]|nr:hypothetical protein [Desulfovibrionaceae bacterium]
MKKNMAGCRAQGEKKRASGQHLRPLVPFFPPWQARILLEYSCFKMVLARAGVNARKKI